MRRLVVGLVMLITVGALGGYVAGAVTKATPPPDAARGSLASLVVVRSDAQAAVDVSSPFAVPSASFRLTVPKGHRDLFDIRFSGDVTFPGGPAFPVAIDVAIDGIAMPPSGLPAWQTATVSPVPFQIERAIGPLAEGTYDVGIVLSGASAYNHQPVQLLGWTLVSQRTSESASTPISPSSTSAPSTV
jgi:hypothetical protein